MSAWIEKRKTGAITVRYKFRGNWGRVKAETLKDARKLQAEIAACHARGIEWRPRLDHSLNPRLSEVCSAYLAEFELSKRSNTLKGWRQSLTLFLRYLRTVKPRGRLDPGLLSKARIVGFFRWMLKERGVSPATARTRAIHASMLWEWSAASEEFGEVVPRYVRAPLPAQPAPEITRAPSWAHCDEAIKVATTCGRPLADYQARLMILCRFTGVRVAQALGFRWDDFDLDAHTLRIRGELGKTRNERRGRVVPISPHLSAIMAGWGRREGWIVEYPTRGATGHSTPTAGVRKHWAASGVPAELWKGRPVHAFRKAFASELIQRGAERFAVEILCGRTTGIQDVYVDPGFLWESMVGAVALIPPLGVVSSSLDQVRSGHPLGTLRAPNKATTGTD